MENKNIEQSVQLYKDRLFEFEQFLPSVLTFFERHRILNQKPFPIIHSIKSRFKDPEHLREKLKRKLEKGITITPENIFSQITDFIGVRVIHIYQEQFIEINKAINEKLESGDWVLVEPAKAFTWDPESVDFYNQLGLASEVRPTFYTSIHYLVKPNNATTVVCCEIQIRTLFEEIWGEIDHTINYPEETESIACKEQLRVLSKLVSTGTRLADSIFRSHNEYEKNKQLKQD